MKKLLSFIIILLLLSPQAFAQEQKVKISDIIETYRGQKVYIHFVEPGETLLTLSRAYGVSIEQIKATNPEAPEIIKAYQIIMIPYGQVDSPRKTAEPAPVAGENAKAAASALKSADSKTTHTIEPKETWYALSRMYKIPVKQLLEANPGVDTLRIGQIIIIPPVTAESAPETESRAPGAITSVEGKPGYAMYNVQPKETLYGIARQFNTTVDELIRLNPVLSEGLKEGQQIMVPAAASSAQTPASTRQETIAGQPQKTVSTAQQEPVKNIEHHVERKETLYSISRKYDVPASEILRLNPGTGGVLRKGEVLRIPVKPAKDQNAGIKSPPDTVVLGRDIHQPATQPAKVPCTPGEETRVFKVVLLLPFALEKTDEINVTATAELPSPDEYPSFDFIQFYQGALIGLDAAVQLGIKLEVDVLDCDAGNGTSKTKQIINSGKLSGKHLIIGPLFAESFELVAAYALKNNIPIVNPLSQRDEILNNAQVIKIQPSAQSIYQGAATQLVQTYPDANFIVMRRNGSENSAMAGMFESTFQKMVKPGHYKTVNYAQTHDQGLMNAMVAGRKNVIVLLTNDKAFIPAILRRLYENHEKYNISIMGMPEWEDMEIDIHYLRSLHTHFFSSRFVDYSDPRTIKFIREFRKRFIAEPETDKFAFMGYDIVDYFTRAMYYYGSDFIDCLPQFEYDGLSEQFRFYHSDKGGYNNTGMFVYRYQEFRRENIRQVLPKNADIPR